MIVLEHVEKKYGSLKAVNDLNLRIQAGDIYGLAGRSGAGKSTVLKMISGLTKPDSGTIHVFEKDVVLCKKEVQKSIGYMPDEFGLYQDLSIMEYLEYYASMYHMYGQKMKERCQEVLKLVEMEQFADTFVDVLYGGMKQRLCIARCLLHDPKLIILDEPFTGLDSVEKHKIVTIIKKLSDAGKTIIMSSHILTDLTQVCDTVGIISQGELMISGNVKEILSGMNHSVYIVIRVLKELEKAIALLKQNPYVESVTVRGNQLRINFSGAENEQSVLLKKLVEEAIPVISFSNEKNDLEELYLTLTQGDDEQ